MIIQPAGQQRVAGNEGQHRTGAENGVSQSKAPPAKAPSTTVKPWMKPPRDQALGEGRGSEPPAKARSHSGAAVASTGGTRRRRRARSGPSSMSDHRQIERRHDDRVGRGKRRQQAAAAEHQPGLVAVPHRRDGVIIGSRSARAAPTGTGCRCRGRSRRAAHRGRLPRASRPDQIQRQVDCIVIVRNSPGRHRPPRCHRLLVPGCWRSTLARDLRRCT